MAGESDKGSSPEKPNSGWSKVFSDLLTFLSSALNRVNSSLLTIWGDNRNPTWARSLFAVFVILTFTLVVVSAITAFLRFSAQDYLTAVGWILAVVVLIAIFVLISQWLEKRTHAVKDDPHARFFVYEKGSRERPIEGAVVTVYISPYPVEGRTDENGIAKVRVGIENINQPCEVLVKAQGYGKYEKRLKLENKIRPIELNIIPPPPPPPPVPAYPPKEPDFEESDRGNQTFSLQNGIPIPPTPYRRNLYDLPMLNFVGREDELNALTQSVTQIEDAVVTLVVAIGGMGKSALTWTWFNDVTPKITPSFEGSMWWSFYHEGETFQNFVQRAVSYTTKRPLDDVAKLDWNDLVGTFILSLTNHRYLIVLDGMERLLRAYWRWYSQYHLEDEENVDQQTANNIPGTKKEAEEIINDEYKEKAVLRTAIENNVDSFFRSILNLNKNIRSRIIITTRLYPYALQMEAGMLSPYCVALPLGGLKQNDVVRLWEEVHKLRGTGYIEFFRKFDNYPLLIRVMAGVISNDDKFSRDFDIWQAKNPQFDLSQIQDELKTWKHRVLQYAIDAITIPKTRDLLNTIALLFRTPVVYKTLVGITVGKERIFDTEENLTSSLHELVDRGLIGRNLENYNIHPVIQAQILASIGISIRKVIYLWIYQFYRGITDENSYVSKDVKLDAYVEQFNALVGLEQYDDAWLLFDQYLHQPLRVEKLNLPLCIALLRMLLDEHDIPRLTKPIDWIPMLDRLGLTHQLMGNINEAIKIYKVAIARYKRENESTETRIIANIEETERRNREASALGELKLHLSSALRHTGGLYLSQLLQWEVLRQARRQNDVILTALATRYLGINLTWRGKYIDARTMLSRSVILFYEKRGAGAAVIGGMGYLAELNVFLSTNVREGQQIAQAAYAACFEPGHVDDVKHVKYEGDLARIRRILGSALFNSNENYSESEKKLRETFLYARQKSLVEEEIASSVWLAELERRRKNYEDARNLLKSIWTHFDRDGYRILHVFALVVLVKVERDTGNKDVAIRRALELYEKSWCDGPPFACSVGLVEATELLREFNVPLPSLPPLRYIAWIYRMIYRLTLSS